MREQTSAKPPSGAAAKELARLEREVARHKPEWKAYVSGQVGLADARKKRTAQAPHKKVMDEHRAGYRAFRRAYRELLAARKESQQ